MRGGGGDMEKRQRIADAEAGPSYKKEAFIVVFSLLFVLVRDTTGTAL